MAPHGRGASPRQPPEKRIALFGGTFDPIHIGHLAIARAAERRFHLDEVHFIPAGRPPHKKGGVETCFTDRYAMVALACADHPRFIPSLMESGPDHAGHEIFYSIDTVRAFKQKRKGTNTKIYFLMGADSFLQIPTWKEYETLLSLCDFIVISRPGFDLAPLRLVIPPELLVKPGSAEAALDPRAISLRQTTVHVIDSVASNVSATEVRERLDHKQSIHGLVPPRVEDYIKKQALYR